MVKNKKASFTGVIVAGEKFLTSVNYPAMYAM
jgi:hypothetical protein